LNQSFANADQNVLTGHSEILSSTAPDRTADGHLVNSEQPEILMTDFGWMNATDLRQARSEPRTKWSALMQAAILDHPFYNPRGWAQISEYARQSAGKGNAIDNPKNKPPKRTRYVFLDIETCGEPNWPVYAGCQGEDNNFEGCENDGAGKYARPTGSYCWHNGPPASIEERICSLVDRVLDSPIFSEEIDSGHSKLVLFYCRCDRRIDEKIPVTKRERPRCISPNRRGGDKVVVVAQSAKPSHSIPGVDLGLPPPAVKPAHLSQQEINAIQSCKADVIGSTEASNSSFERPILLSHKATNWGANPVRHAITRLKTGRSDVVTLDTRENFPMEGMTYESMLVESKFAAVTSGDCLFSFRFSEVLSAGAIPVIYANGWVLPFSRDLIPWDDYMVVIDESKTMDTISILESISVEERCRLRKRGREVYERYVKDRSANLQGVIDTLEARRLRMHANEQNASWKVMTPFHEDTSIYCWAEYAYEKFRNTWCRRFNWPWDNLNEKARTAAALLGLNKKVWDNDRQSVKVDFAKRYGNLSLEEQKAVDYLRLCTHASRPPLTSSNTSQHTKARKRYREDLSKMYWEELPESGRIAAELLGYTQKTWDEDASIDVYDVEWDDLSNEKKEAATLLGLKTWFTGGNEYTCVE
jgi:hypothetical protein